MSRATSSGVRSSGLGAMAVRLPKSNDEAPSVLQAGVGAGEKTGECEEEGEGFLGGDGGMGEKTGEERRREHEVSIYSYMSFIAIFAIYM